MTKEEIESVAAKVALMLKVSAADAADERPDGTPVVVCTEHRGVFFGYTDDADAEPMTLRRARMCVYWDESRKGVFGLASDGPGSKCRISSPVTVRKLAGVTAVLDATDEAVAAWEAAPWA